MYSLIALVVILLSAIFVYKKRFTSETKILGLYFVQLYYLIMTPITALLLFDIGSDIFSRPIIGKLPIPNNLIFNAYNFSVMLTVVGAAIHSTSTSVYQSFKKKAELENEAFHTNEMIHGPWSHNMIYLGAILSVTMLGLLELNHPYFGRVVNFNFLLLAGIVLGIIGTVAVLRGGHVGFQVIASFLASFALGYGIRNYALNINSYPMAIISLASLVTLFILLSMMSVIFALSHNLSKKVIMRTFPKGHPFHQGISLKVLTMRIEKEFIQSKK